MMGCCKGPPCDVASIVDQGGIQLAAGVERFDHTPFILSCPGTLGRSLPVISAGGAGCGPPHEASNWRWRIPKHPDPG